MHGPINIRYILSIFVFITRKRRVECRPQPGNSYRRSRPQPGTSYRRSLSNILPENCQTTEQVRKQKKQELRCAYNLTLRGVRSTTVTVEKQQVLRVLSVCL